MARMNRCGPLYCWELLDAEHPLLTAVRGLYESALAAEERIPWHWLEGAVKRRAGWRPGGWGVHLLVASPTPEAERPDQLAGFAYAVHLPGFGGYIGYVAVSPQHRGRGVGGRLFEQSFQLLATDASAVDEELPFVIWESRKPERHAPTSDWEIWNARLKLFANAGGAWIDGATVWSPNWNDVAAPPVPLQLFLSPVDDAAEEFDAVRLRAVVGEFLTRVYKAAPGQDVWDRALADGKELRLRPPAAAGARRDAVRERNIGSAQFVLR